MVYGKIQQQKLSYKITINLNNIKCPVCKRMGEYHKENEDIICECGFIIQTPNKYVGGVKINTNADFQKYKERKKQ